MIPYEQALKHVLAEIRDYGSEQVTLKHATGRVLAEAIKADRDFPPADRSTRDGIAVASHALKNGRRAFEIFGILAAGTPSPALDDNTGCMEIMTGAVIPFGADTVIPYEHLTIEHGIATLLGEAKEKQFIHFQGSDCTKGTVLLNPGRTLGAADIGLLASVGKSKVVVRKLPTVAVISTGNELVDTGVKPKAHQLRKSNAYSLYSALKAFNIDPMVLHLSDDPDMIRQKLSVVLDQLDVLLISGGVSMGKFDFIPRILKELQVEIVFHKVKQRPGKPFLFGVHTTSKSLVFSFPGNPVSTFYNYHLYFVPWLRTVLGFNPEPDTIPLGAAFEPEGDFLRLQGAVIQRIGDTDYAVPVRGQHSGNLIGLTRIDGFVLLNPENTPIKKGTRVPFIRTRYYDA